MNKELIENKAKSLEKELEKQRIFSEKQILSAEKDVKKWLQYIVSDSGWGKIEVFINAREQIIDVKPTINLRHLKE